MPQEACGQLGDAATQRSIPRKGPLGAAPIEHLPGRPLRLLLVPEHYRAIVSRSGCEGQANASQGFWNGGNGATRAEGQRPAYAV